MKLLILLHLMVLAVIISAKAVNENTKEGHHCEYNGKKYEEGEEMIATRRLCLKCICSKNFIEPSDYNCSVITCKHIEPLERGCRPLYDEIECCPADWNCTGAQPLASKCEKRYLIHYEVKGCTPVYDNSTNCPSRYECPKETQLNTSVCRFKGKNYKEGDDIDVGNPCQKCSCRKSFAHEGLDIDCISIECPQLPLNDSCHYEYQADKCCPVKTQCSADGTAQIKEKNCEYNNKTYHYGERIYPEEDKCATCICNEQWTGIGGNSCRIHDCALELKRKQLLNGCIPIYHEATCCPIEFYCGTPEEEAGNYTPSYNNNDEIASGNACSFKGKQYSLGQTLDIHHPTHCVTCTCITPPDFTCVHKSCPRPPNDDYENCMSNYKPGECCPTYDCKKPPAPASAPVPMPQCSPVKCPDSCSVVTVHNSCPFCKCQDKLCAPPKCEDGCHTKMDVPEGQCPGCDCPLTMPVTSPQCAPVKCLSHCFEITNQQGCPMCMCGPLCSPPKCEPGCEIQRNIPDGQCPQCHCSGEDRTQVQCSPVKCPVGCTENVGESGCPTCDCKPQCSPPKCDDGCYLNPYPTGPCPECVCENKESVPQAFCAPVHCGPLCHEAFEGDGCPTCICDPMCSTPVCEGNCHLEHDPNTGPCPVCVCDKDVSLCPSVTCGPACEKRIASDGCPTCSCDASCSAPRCDSGCHLEYDRTASPCPFCVCPVVHCAPVICDESCVVAAGDNGCPTCICNPQCAPLKCEAGCELRYSKETGPCPVCMCSINYDIPVLQCSPPKCDEPCQIDYSAKPCPSCNCGAPNIPVLQCSPPKCDEPCQIDYSTKPCPSCNCEVHDIPLIQCSPPKCEAGCEIDYSTKPCPSCSCESSGIDCTLPKCDPGCSIDFNSKPCPSCTCDVILRRAPTVRVQCAPLRCPTGCKEDYTSKPCPSCACGDATGVQCSPVKCDAGCWTDYNAKPCPSCACDSNPGAIIQCLPPRCAAGCQLDYNARPCPRCVCNTTTPARGRVQCSPLRCPIGCRTDYSVKPCPRCACDADTFSALEVMCSPPKCDAGCNIDFATKPCPSCICNEGLTDIFCSPPKCDEPGCSIDYSAKPCPSCKCGGNPEVMCSPPKCDDPGCKVDYSSKPCPSCTCAGGTTPVIFCSTPRCDPGCNIDYTTKPCPSCKCGGFPDIMCSPPKCDEPGCTLDYSSKPCPSCTCVGTTPVIMCSPPRCGPGCNIDYTTKPCPSCQCGGIPNIMCSPPKCDEPGCKIDYSTKPCPSCKCEETAQVMCSPPKCDPGCNIDYSTTPCPSCKCGGVPFVMCSPPKCDSGCQVDYSAKPCPGCKCSDLPSVMCAPIKCDDPGCTINYSAKPCPSCECSTSGSGPTDGVLCSMPKCDPGCSIDYNAKPCPSCNCNPGLFCSPVKCESGCVQVSPGSGCPYCECKPLCSMPNCGIGCRVDYSTEPCPTCLCDRSQRRNAPLHLMAFNPNSNPVCRTLKCGPDCEMGHERSGSDPCPMCICNGRVGEKIKCMGMHCERPCRFERFTPYGCPTCICHPIPCPDYKCGPTTVLRKLPENRCPECVPISGS